MGMFEYETRMVEAGASCLYPEHELIAFRSVCVRFFLLYLAFGVGANAGNRKLPPAMLAIPWPRLSCSH